jgi:glycerol-3-phosphate dehydrogenase
MSPTAMIQYDVCIVGSGVVGLLTALGLSRMGFNCIVLEQSFPGSGASLNCAGVLHSGARYAVVDSELAKQCFSASQKLLGHLEK